MRRAVVFEAERTGYSIDQVIDDWTKPMTVGELRDILEEYEDEDLFILSHDRGYTYGSIREQMHFEEDDDGDWEKIW